MARRGDEGRDYRRYAAGGGNNLISADFRMGQPIQSNVWISIAESIGYVKLTRGTETSKYPEEEKIIMISLVVASERERA